MKKKPTKVVFLMAGGKGERFWPKSRADYPKQLHVFFGTKTLLESSCRRAFAITGSYDQIFLACTKELKIAIQNNIQNFPLPNKNIIHEPQRKNTAAIIALATIVMGNRFPNAVQIYLPVDPYIDNDKQFVSDLRAATQIAQQQQSIVTIGIRPTRPETNYGYMLVKEATKKDKQSPELYLVKSFLEKPSLSKAKNYLRKKKNVFWNAGIFVMSEEVAKKEFIQHAPEIYKPLTKAVASGKKAIANAFAKLPALPIDIAIMEKSQRIMMIAARFAWDDLGSWLAQERLSRKHPQNNHNLRFNNKNVQLVSLNSKRTTYSVSHDLLALIDVEDLFIIEDHEVLLIARRSGIDKMRELLTLIKNKKALQKYLLKQR